MASTTKELKKKYKLFCRFIAYNVILENWHYNQVATMDHFIIHRRTIRQPLNLNCLILKEMDDVRNHKSRALPYGALLTKDFELFRVKFRNQHDQHIDGGFTERI